VTQLIPLIDAIPPIGGKIGAPLRKPEEVMGDRGYDSERPSRDEARNTAAGWASSDTWWSKPSRCFTSSDDCEHGSTNGMTSTRRS
jgi:hypothetical protein